MNEIWKTIKGFGNYEISNLGRVKSHKYRHSHIMSNSRRKDGYCRVTLCANGIRKNYFVHRLVAEAFIDNPNGYPQVNHKDENKMNNSVDNLEWCESEYNMNYSNGTPVEQYTIDGKFIKRYDGVRQAQRYTNIERATISRCCKGIYKQAGGFVWRYSQEVIYEN